MKHHQVFATLLSALLGLIFADTASAMYHPGLGRHMQRDPNGMQMGPAAPRVAGGPAVSGGFIQRDFNPHQQYADGMSLYQYVRSNPIRLVDPMGTDSRPPEYQPDLPPIIPPGDSVKIIIRDQDEIPCGTVWPSNLRNCNASVTWHGLCVAEQAAYALVVRGDLCKYMSNYIDGLQGGGVEFGCPEGKKCCNKARFNGTYPVEVSIERVKLSWSCSISANVTGTIDVTGEVGSCH